MQIYLQIGELSITEHRFIYQYRKNPLSFNDKKKKKNELNVDAKASEEKKILNVITD